MYNIVLAVLLKRTCGYYTIPYPDCTTEQDSQLLSRPVGGMLCIFVLDLTKDSWQVPLSVCHLDGWYALMKKIRKDSIHFDCLAVAYTDNLIERNGTVDVYASVDVVRTTITCAYLCKSFFFSKSSQVTYNTCKYTVYAFVLYVEMHWDTNDHRWKATNSVLKHPGEHPNNNNKSISTQAKLSSSGSAWR